jgi:hypothetical protein
MAANDAYELLSAEEKQKYWEEKTKLNAAQEKKRAAEQRAERMAMGLDPNDSDAEYVPKQAPAHKLAHAIPPTTAARDALAAVQRATAAQDDAIKDAI